MTKPVAQAKRLYIFVAFLGLMMFLFSWVNHVVKPTNGIESLQLTSSRCAFAPSSQDVPVAHILNQLRWTNCSLPDNWNSSHADQHGDAWYRLQVSSHADNTDMALYMASFSMNAEAWLNGHSIGSGGDFAEPTARHWNNPLFFAAPASLLHASDNTLLIHVKGYANSSAGLGLIYWGEKDKLHPVYWQHVMLSQGVSYGTFAIALLLGILFLCLYAMLRQKTYLYFAVASLSSCLYIADVFVLYIPMSQHFWEVMVHGSILVSQYFFLLFILETLQLKCRHIHWLKQFSLLHLCLSIPVLLLSSDINILVFALVAHSLGILWLFYLSILLCYHWFKLGRVMIGVFAGAVSFELLMFINDWAPWVFAQGVTPPFIFPLGPLAFSLAASWMLMLRFIASSQQEYRYRHDLKASLQRQKAKLHDKHEKLAKLEQQQAIQHEQDRITRELHDGLGAHLVGAKALLHSDIQQAQQLLDYSMDELRTLMDSLDSHADLLSKLGMMRHRLEDRLNAQGIYFDWQVWNIPQYMPQNPQTVHHVLRIVQEAIHNIEKHAHATSIKVFIDLSGIVIQDNGCGFDMAHYHQGRGLKNIRWRAAQALATIDINANAQGTTLHLYWHDHKEQA